MYPYLNYGNIIWGNTYPSRLESIIKLQNKIIRVTSFSDFRDHTRPIFRNLSVLPIDDLNNEVLLIFFFSKTLPTTFNHFFKSKSTKNRNAQITKEYSRRFKGCEILNNLPIFITKNLKSVRIFKLNPLIFF